MQIHAVDTQQFSIYNQPQWEHNRDNPWTYVPAFFWRTRHAKVAILNSQKLCMFNHFTLPYKDDSQYMINHYKSKCKIILGNLLSLYIDPTSLTKYVAEMFDLSDRIQGGATEADADQWHGLWSGIDIIEL